MHIRFSMYKLLTGILIPIWRMTGLHQLTGSHTGKQVLIPKLKLAPSDINLPFVLHRTQFPVRLSYSMTINKSQGQTFDKVGIFLPAPVFSHGQLYVAFLRARMINDVTVSIISTEKQQVIEGKHTTINVVYKEILSSVL